MSIEALLLRLDRYLNEFPEEHVSVNTFSRFLRRHPDAFERTCIRGHVTASGWILSHDYESVLLLHHRKLGLWVQPGGHCDGDSDVLGVSKKEIEEELGLSDLILLHDGALFDIDIHPIPARPGEPAHHHFDVRFAWRVKEESKFQTNEESLGARWFSVREIALDMKAQHWDASVVRMAQKSIRLFLGPITQHKSLGVFHAEFK